MQPQALLVGNSDGIGLATTRRLLGAGWKVIGISRSRSLIMHADYQHHVADVADAGKYSELLCDLFIDCHLDLCVYFAGIGEQLDLSDMSYEPRIIDVNFTGMVRTAAGIIPRMVRTGRGHFIGISSVADELFSAEAPSYHASKAGFSNYLKGLSLALKPRGVQVTNVRFGFVDTKMAKSDSKPLMMSVEKAVDHLEFCIRKKPACYTAPRIAVPFVKFRKLLMRLGAK